jgi:hypothetical protein
VQFGRVPYDASEIAALDLADGLRHYGVHNALSTGVAGDEVEEWRRLYEVGRHVKRIRSAQGECLPACPVLGKIQSRFTSKVREPISEQHSPGADIKLYAGHCGS